MTCEQALSITLRLQVRFRLRLIGQNIRIRPESSSLECLWIQKIFKKNTKTNCNRYLRLLSNFNQSLVFKCNFDWLCFDSMYSWEKEIIESFVFISRERVFYLKVESEALVSTSDFRPVLTKSTVSWLKSTTTLLFVKRWHW